jgi:hypothetical protein
MLLATIRSYRLQRRPPPRPRRPHGDTSSSNFINNGTPIYGNCDYYNDTGEGMWYMEVATEWGTRYIWVQRLYYGSTHNCYWTTGNGWTKGTINQSPCSLTNV